MNFKSHYIDFYCISFQLSYFKIKLKNFTDIEERLLSEKSKIIQSKYFNSIPYKYYHANWISSRLILSIQSLNNVQWIYHAIGVKTTDLKITVNVSRTRIKQPNI